MGLLLWVILYFLEIINYFAPTGGNSALSDKWKKEFLPEHCVSSVEVFDPEKMTWSPGPELPNAMCGPGKTDLYHRPTFIGFLLPI